jgi:hypothetical protein
MKLSRSKFGILDKVLSRAPLFPVKAYPQFQAIIQKNQTYYSEVFSSIVEYALDNKAITYVSESVRKIFDETPKVSKMLWGLRDDVQSSIGVLLFSGGTSYFYGIKNSTDEKKVFSYIMTFQNDKFMSFSAMHYNYGTPHGETKLNEDYCFDIASEMPGYNILFPIQMVTGFLLFTKYAEHEIKFADGTRVKKLEVNGNTYKNELEIPINIFDSKWFTTFVKSDAFTVSGHFRLQPYGEGLQKRKLIWVEEYTKDGYSRTAKMLVENE